MYKIQLISVDREKNSAYIFIYHPEYIPGNDEGFNFTIPLHILERETNKKFKTGEYNFDVYYVKNITDN